MTPPGSASAGARFTNIRYADSSGVPGARLTFEVSGIDLCVVNAMRRAMLAEVPTAAFRSNESPGDAGSHPPGVVVKANTSTLHNEFIAHRVSMVPLCLNENQLRVFEPWQWQFKLRVKNTGALPRAVTSADFEVMDNMGVRVPDAIRSAMFPANPMTGDHVLLTRLRPSAHGDGQGEELHIECTASLGTGKQHARWSPVSCCHFRNKVDVAASNKALAQSVTAENERRQMESLPLLTDEEQQQMAQQHAVLGAHRCFLKNEYGEPAVFEMFVETESRLRPAYVVFKALAMLQARVTKVRDALLAPGSGDDIGASTSAMTEPRVELLTTPNADDFYEIILRGEDHTLGNLVQGLLYRLWVRQGSSKDVSYVGYYQPHPLEDHIVLRIKCARPLDDVRARLADGLHFVREELRALAMQWIQASDLGTAGIVEVNELIRVAAARVPPVTGSTK